MKLFEVLSLFTYTITKIIPKKKNRWLFGAWFGDAVSDNTKAISDYVEKNYPDIEMIWVTNNVDSIKLSHGKVVKRNSLASLKYITTSKVAFMNQGFGDFNACNFLGGIYKVQLWHGVTFKKIFKDAMKKPTSFKERVYDKLFDYINSYDLYIAPSDKQFEVIKGAFNCDESKILKCGQPRNEVLFSKEFKEKSREKIFKEVNDKASKIIVYMPTFRDNKTDLFSFGDYVDKIKELEDKYDFILIEKSHYEASKKANKTYNSSKGVYFLKDEKAEVLLAAADILISDYSSCFFDYLITDKPIIHYLYDYDYYVNKDRGVYYDKDDVVCGDYTDKLDDLFNLIIDNLNNPNKNKALREVRRKQFIEFESKDNSKHIIDEVLKRIK